LHEAKLKEMKIKIAILLISIITLITSCYKTPEYPATPTIEFSNYSNVSEPYNTSSNPAGSMLLNFTDGDGDLGKLDGIDSSSRIILANNFYAAFDTFIIPIIPKKGTTNAISGTLEVKFDFINGICLTPGVTQPTDTLIFNVYIEDRAGNKSNIITTPPLVIQCP